MRHSSKAAAIKRIITIGLTLLCVAGAIAALVMTIMAIRFHEWGRVIFYLMLTIFAAEAAVLCLLQAKK